MMGRLRVVADETPASLRARKPGARLDDAAGNHPARPGPAAGHTRQYINILTGNLIRMFRWAAEELLIPLDTYRALEIITPLKAGRTTAPESTPDTPVSRAQVDAALPHCSTPVRALIELQWLTGARPGERLNEILSKHTGQSVETIAKDTDRDNFLSAEEAVKYGLVDKVLVSREPA